jgi:hypothetical protein
MKMQNMQNTRLIMAVIVGMAAMPAWAQPNWSVDPAGYEFIMTVTGIAKIECMESLDPNDMIAAFVGNEVRGVKHFDEFFDGQYLSYLIVYDNNFSGSDVHFKIYDASADTIYNALETISFQANAGHGNSAQPFRFHTQAGIEEVNLSTYEISPHSQAQGSVAILTALNELGEETEVEYTFVNDSNGTNNHYFTLDGNQLVLSVDASLIEEEILDLHIAATPASGCAANYSFQLTLSETTSIGAADATGIQPVLIYPNPTLGDIQWVSSESFDKIVVCNMQGKVVMQDFMSSAKSLDLSDLTPGVFMVNFISTDSIHSAIVIRN